MRVGLACPHRWLLSWNRFECSCWIPCIRNIKWPHSQLLGQSRAQSWSLRPRPHGAHTSVHHTSGMHVLHSAAQLHEVLPHSPLRNKPLLLLEVLWGDRQTAWVSMFSARVAQGSHQQRMSKQRGARMLCQHLSSAQQSWGVGENR